MKFFSLLLGIVLGLSACKKKENQSNKTVQLMVLGAAQDGGYPQAGCIKDCCMQHYQGKTQLSYPTCLALSDNSANKVWFFECTPGFANQWQNWKNSSGKNDKAHPDGFFLTHAHVGHYAGLINLGREIMGTQHVPVFVLPKMFDFLSNNGPWSQLVALENIALNSMKADSAIELNAKISVTPFVVPHRDEFSETAGFKININGKNVLFIPDIDKWQKWDRSILKEIEACDQAFLDATFFKNGELNRDMSEIPHPFVEESMKLFEGLSATNKDKVWFIHFNHTNPLLFDAKAQELVEKLGFHVAKMGDKFEF
jgi:pyrroloquinoline quinone biosynthesis protein B